MGKFINFLHYAGKLKQIKRTGWVTQKIKQPESVADHTYRVTLLAMLLAKEYGLDETKLMKMALIHDLAEGIVGDIVLYKGNKKISNEKDKFKKEQEAMKKIFLNLKEGKEFYSLWIEYERGVSLEAQFLKQLDKIEMIIQALEYEEENDPKNLNEFWINAKKHVKDKKLLILFEKLEGKRKK